MSHFKKCIFLLFISVFMAHFSYADQVLQCRGVGTVKEIGQYMMDGTVSIHYESQGSIQLSFTMSPVMKDSDGSSPFEVIYRYNRFLTKDSVHGSFMYGSNPNSVDGTISTPLSEREFLDQLKEGASVPLNIGCDYSQKHPMDMVLDCRKHVRE